MKIIKLIFTFLTTVTSLAFYAQTVSDSNETVKFEKMKGNLKVPANEYISFEVCCEYGEELVKIFSHCATITNQLRVTCDSNSYAIAIASGQILSVKQHSDGWSVTIQHGQYFTSYSQLETVTMKNGDVVQESDSIGIIKTINERTILRFDMFTNEADIGKLNPVEWLKIK